MNEREAIRRLRQGDIHGLESLVRAYQVEATRVAYLITRDAGLAEDVMQSAFLQVYDRIDQFDEGRPFAPWFFRIVANAALKLLRRPHVSLDQDISIDEIMPDVLPGPEEALTVQEMQSVVWDALSKLSAEQRAVVVMRYYLGLTETQMAAQMDRPVGTIRWRIHAAHQKLRQILSGKWNAIAEPHDAPMIGVTHHE